MAKPGACNIKVGVRVRPVIARETSEPVRWKCDGNRVSRFDPETGKVLSVMDFDQVFDHASQNKDIFNAMVKPLVKGAVDGFNATILAYGQTSSGKTHTMMGTSTDQGIVPLCMDYIFQAIQEVPDQRCFILGVSFLEVYNEKVRDLLCPEKTDLKIQEDIMSGGIRVDCKTEMVNNALQMLQLMDQGNQTKTIGETNMNERSSRSHTIFRIIIESQEEGKGSQEGGVARVSQINLVDLAGSERASATGATGQRYKEGCAINRSLLQLGNVVQKLSEDKGKFIDYRSSKLTRILQPSLSGNANIGMICNVTPVTAEQTQCTLLFASRASTIKLAPHLNEVMDDATLIKRHSKKIARLENELKDAASLKKTNETLVKEIAKLREMVIMSSLQPFRIQEDRERALRRQTWGGPEMRRVLHPVLPTLAEESFAIDRGMTSGGFRESLETNGMDRAGMAELEASMQGCSLDVSSLSSEEQPSAMSLASLGNRASLVSTPLPKSGLDKGALDQDTPSAVLRERIRQLQRKVTNSPGTPKSVLHERIKKLEEDIRVLSGSVKTNPELLQERISVLSESSVPVSVLRVRLEQGAGPDAPQQPGTPPAVLRSKAKSIEERYNELEKEFETLREFTTLERQLLSDDKQEKILQLEAAVEELKRSNSSYDEMCRELQKTNAEMSSEKALLQDRLAELGSSNVKLQKTLDGNMSEQHLDLKKQLMGYKEKLTAVTNESQDWISEKELLLNRHDQKVAELQQCLAEAWTEQEALRAALAPQSSSEHGCQTSKDEEELLAPERVAQLQQQLAEARAEQEALRAALEASQASSAEHGCQTSKDEEELLAPELVAQLQQQLAEACAEQEALRAALEASQASSAEHGCQTSKDEEECESLRLNMFFLNQELENLKTELSLKQDGLKVTNSEIARLKSELSDSKKHVQKIQLESQNKFTVYDQEVEELRSKLEEVTIQKKTVADVSIQGDAFEPHMEKLRVLEETNHDLQEQISHLTQDKAALAQQYAQLTQELATLKEDFAESRAASDVLSKQVEEKITVKTTPSEEEGVDGVTQVFEFQHDSLTIMSASTSEDAEVEALRREVAELRSQLQGGVAEQSLSSPEELDLSTGQLRQQYELLRESTGKLHAQLQAVMHSIAEKGLLADLPHHLTGSSPDIMQLITDQVAQLQETNKVLEDEVCTLQKHKQVTEDRNLALTALCDETKARLEEQTQVVTQMTRRISELEEQLTSVGSSEGSQEAVLLRKKLIAEVQCLKPAATLDHKSLPELHETFLVCIMEKQQEVAAVFRGEIRSLREAKSALEGRQADSEIQNAELKSQLCELKVQLCTRVEEAAVVEREMQALMEQRNVSSEEIVKLQTSLTSAEQMAQELSAKVELLTTDLQTAQLRTEMTQQEGAPAAEEWQTLRQHNEFLASESSALKKQLSDLQRCAANTKKYAEDKESELNNLLKSSREEHEKQLSEYHADSLAIRLELEKNLELAEQRVAAYEREISLHELQRLAVVHQEEQWQSKLDLLQVEVDTSQQTITSLQVRLEEQSTCLREAEEKRCVQLDKARQEFAEQTAELESKYESVLAHEHQLQTEVDVLSQQLEGAREQQQTLQNSLTGLQARYSDVLAKLQDLQTEHASCRESVEQARATLEEQQNKFDSEVAYLRANSSTAVNKLTAEKDELAETNKDLESKLSALTQEYDDVNEELSGLRDVRAKYTSLQAEHSECAELRSQLQTSRQNERIYEQKLAEYEANIVLLTEKIQALESRYSALQAQNENDLRTIHDLKFSLDRVNESAQSLASKVALRDERIAALLEASEAEKINSRRLEDRVEELQNLLEEASTDKDLLQANSNKLELQLQTVNSDVKEQNAALKCLQSDLLKVNARYESLQEEQKILLQQLDESKQLAAELTIKNDEAEEEFQDMLKSYKIHEAKRLEFEAEAYTRQLAGEKMEKRIKELEEALATQQVQAGEGKRVAELQQMLSASQLELRASKARTAELERLASDASRTSAQFEEQIKELRQELVSVRGELAIFKRKIIAEDLPHKNEAEMYKKQAEFLETRVRTLQSEARHARATQQNATFQECQRCRRGQRGVCQATQTSMEERQSSVAVQAPPDNEALWDRRDGYLPSSAITEAARMYGMRDQIRDLEGRVTELQKERVRFKDELRRRNAAIRDLQQQLANKENSKDLAPYKI